LRARAWRKEQRAESKEHRAKSKEQRAKSKGSKGRKTFRIAYFENKGKAATAGPEERQ
jgi:hypothetical protein